MTCNYSPWSRYSGGGQKSVHMLAGEMARQGLKVAVVYSKAPWEKIAPHAESPYDEHWAGFFALRPGIGSPLRFLNGILFYSKVRSLSTDRTVLHGNGDEASLLWLIRNKRKFVYTNRYPEFPAFLYGRDWTKARAWTAIFFREPRFVAIAMGIRHADKVTVTSTYSLAETRKAFGLGAGDVSVVPNGVDPVFLDLPMDTRESTGVLFFGRLTRAKGPDLALEAYARLPADLRNAHPLRFIGAGPIRCELEARANALGLTGVEFLGWKTGVDLARTILSCGAVCLPSREESFGNSVVEALALGQTLVSTRAGSIPEVVGPWGRLVAPDDPEALAAGLEAGLRAGTAWTEKCRQREFIRARYSWGRASIRYRAIYNPLKISKVRRLDGHAILAG
ncbi:MAG TPA: glycosyltransferase family 4 protein [Fibrobacteria bacterium]|nr:glycosyltransferase family 4 protein [Fibrobacteria bacterium]